MLYLEPNHAMSSTRRLPLQDLALAAGTRIAYGAQLRNFIAHAGISHERLLTMSARRIDRLLSLFIQHSFDASRPYSYAQHALHAVVYHRQDLKAGGLLVSRQCLRGWKNKHEVKSHPPLTWELTVVIACTLARSGYHAPAIAMLVGFDCYLRVRGGCDFTSCLFFQPRRH